MAFARRKNAIAVRRPISQSPKFVALKSRVGGLSKRATNIAKEAEVELPMLTLAGAALPAVYQRYSGKALPTVGGIDPELVAGGVIMAISMALKGGTRRRVMAFGAGCAAPAVSRAIKVGSVKVGEDDELGADEDDGEI
jgi:hypothetical protein